MYNANKPSATDLPSAMQLLKSTTLAILVAILLLIGAVLPAEYGIDPTGIGRLLGLTEMGEIKQDLAAQAEADRIAPQSPPQEEPITEPVIQPETPAPVEPPTSVELTAPVEPPIQVEPQWRDRFSFTLTPDEGVEYKLVMPFGGVAEYHWIAEGGVVNYDLHGDGGGQSISYEKGRGIAEDRGELTAAFAGNHGWFWRNRTDAPVTVTVFLNGEYTDIKTPY